MIKKSTAIAIVTTVSVTTALLLLPNGPGAVSNSGQERENSAKESRVYPDGEELTRIGNVIADGAGTSAEPGDPMFADLWALKYGQKRGIDAVSAWKSSTGSRNVVVAVLDSGMDINHEDLKGNIWTNPNEIPGNGVDDDSNGFIDDVHGWDFLNGDNDPTGGQAEVHATHVAGIIGARGDNGLGVTGVNWDLSIMPLRFMDEKGGFTSDAAEALKYAIKMGAQVSCNSWGGAGYEPEMAGILDDADAAGMIFVASAGNGGKDNEAAPRYPTSYEHENVIGVAASNKEDGVASFTNYGALSIDLAAPGVDIMSTLPSGGYGIMFGSSMAAPHVAGVCALLKAANPGLKHREIRGIVIGTADEIPAWRGKTVTGGRLNAQKAMQRAFEFANVQAELMDMDDAAGNGDGRANPGEEIVFRVSLRNLGYSSARGVEAALSVVSGGGYVSIIDSKAQYGDIDPVSSRQASSGGFKVKMSETMPASVPLLFSFEFKDADGRKCKQILPVQAGYSFTVDGAVVDAGTGENIGAAELLVRGPYGLTLRADAGGKYSFVAVSGTYSLTAKAEGYLAQTRENVVIDQGNRLLSFSLQRAKAVESSAFQAAGTPIQQNTPAAAPASGSGGGGGCFLGF